MKNLISLAFVYSLVYSCGYQDQSSLTNASVNSSPRKIGINALNLVDDHSYQELNHQGTPHWKKNVDYAQWLGAEFIRVTASYEAEKLGRAQSMADRICHYYRYNRNVKYLVAITDMNLSGKKFNTDYKFVKAWYDGHYEDTDYWQYTKTLIDRVNRPESLGGCPNAIFAWEMGNEVFCKTCFTDPSGGSDISIEEQKIRRAHYEFFLMDFATKVKQISAPGQKFGLGLVRSGWASVYKLNGVKRGGFDNGFGKINNAFRSEKEMFSGSPYLFMNWIDIYSHKDIDFITIHFYGTLTPWHEETDLPHGGMYDPIHLFQTDLNLAKLTGKPLMIEEFGSTPHGNHGYMRDPTRELRKESFLQIISWARQENVEYIVPWQATFHRFQRTGLSWFGGSCFEDPNAKSSHRCQIETALQNY